MKDRKSGFERKIQPRIIGRRVVIACEGSKTEPLYFDAIRQSLRLATVNIHVVKHEGSDPLSIVTAALKYREQQKKEKRWRPGDEAWAVFDGDEHIANNPANWNEALQLAHGKGIRLAVCNPSFELWYLLHFEDQTANVTRQQALAKLKKHISGYDKGKSYYPLHLADRTDAATERAKLLAVRAARNHAEPHPNPTAGVVDLVALLMSMKNDANHCGNAKK